MGKGCVHIYCGDGKGKTSAAFGLAVRFAGHGGQVVIAQFLKDGQSGEGNMLRQLENVHLLSANPCGKFSFQMSDGERTETARALETCFQEMCRQAEAYQAGLVVLDEIMAAISCGFLSCDAVCKFLQTRPDHMEVVLTGRNPPQELLDLADYVSEICKIKHPFDRGIPAREGIEW